MAIREIVLMGDPVLRTRAKEVVRFGEELERLVQDMYETMYHASGIGLAAPQVGIPERVLIVDLQAEKEEDERGGPIAVVNPRLVEVGEELDRASEGCLSMPGIEDVVERPLRVKVEGFDPSGQPVVLEADGLFARALQHEIDHLDGILFIDRLTPLKRKMQMTKWKKAQAEAKTG